MTEDDYLAWRDNPVTQWVMRAYGIAADALEHNWKEQSWETGLADQSVLTEFRIKADAYRSIEEADFTDIEHFHKAKDQHDEHERDQSDRA